MSKQILDKIDICVLRSLQRDARKHFKEIASQCNLSTDTIKNRFDTLKKKGIIKGTTIIIDPAKLSNKCVVLIGIETVKPHVSHILDMVKKIPEICMATKAIGDYDIEALSILKNIEQVGNIKEMIEDLPDVKYVHANIWVGQPLLCPQNFEFEE